MGGSTLPELTRLVLAFRDARDWKQFHKPKDLALSLALEAAEVLELFQWKDGRELEAHLRKKRARLGEELSDVLYWTVLMAHEAGIDLEAAFQKKLAKNSRKYPISKARGSSKKYTEL